MKLLIITQAVDRKDPVLGFFHAWIAKFAERYESVVVIALRTGDYSLPRNVVVRTLGKEAGGSRLSYLFRFYRYIISERHNYDVVFVHMNPIYAVFGCPLWRVLGKKSALWYVHMKVDLKLRLAEALVDRIYTVSEGSFGISSKKTLVTGHGIDLGLMESKPKRPTGEKVVSVVGRIAPVKNLDFALRAFALAKSSLGAPARLEFVGGFDSSGERAYKEELERTARELGIGDSVSFRGAIPNSSVPEYLGSVDLALNATARGSYDKAILEALSCGVPTLVVNDLLQGDLEPLGLYVAPGSVERYAAALRTALSGAPIDRARLRGIVDRGHSLDRLIDTIARDLR